MILFSSLLHKGSLIYYCWILFHCRLLVYKNSQYPVVRYPDLMHKYRFVLDQVGEQSASKLMCLWIAAARGQNGRFWVWRSQYAENQQYVIAASKIRAETEK